jgi:hypothetical protein
MDLQPKEQASTHVQARSWQFESLEAADLASAAQHVGKPRLDSLHVIKRDPRLSRA